jgi:hypothetical protein
MLWFLKPLEMARVKGIIKLVGCNCGDRFMDKRKVLLKRFLIHLVVASCLTNYFWILMWIGITINPFIALGILFITFTFCLYYMHACVSFMPLMVGFNVV